MFRIQGRSTILSVKRVSAVTLVSLLTLLALGPVAPVSAVTLARIAPKVAIVVGPAGAATDNYRRLADEAAAAARKYTPNIFRVYSPDATWPAVKNALKDASIVVYLGHGYGFPSRYRNSLAPDTQDGMGLNPNVGAADTHQYFGEARIASEITLAKDAVVVLSHLCYASGNSEPGLPEGSLEVGQQRVDNFAAGFIKAGAAAVIAEGHLGPAYYVQSILAGKGSLDRIWRNSPSYNGNLLRFDSLRSPGYTAQMDPDQPNSGFYRSIVLRDGLVAANTLAGAIRMPSGPSLPPVEPSLAGLGIEFDAPDLASPPVAGSKTNFTFKIAASDASALPKRLMVSVRWDPLDGPATSVPASPTRPAPSTGPGPVISPVPSAAPDSIDLVSPEVLGAVVAPVVATRTKTGLSVAIRVPTRAGLYRLVGTIHDGDGVAYDAATQALMPALIVRVTGPVAVRYDAPSTAFASAGGMFTLHVGVTNLGAGAWGTAAINHRVGGAEVEPARRATLVARWVTLFGQPGGAPAPEHVSVLPADLAPGASVTVGLNLAAPAAPGDYLLLLDVVSPQAGSLAIAGAPPGLVRVNVSESAGSTAP
jgi:hypothetical protein